MMSEREQEKIGGRFDTLSRPGPLLLQAGRVRERSRLSLPRRLAQAAGAALQSRFQLKAAAASSSSLHIPLAPEQFLSGTLETHIARALGRTEGLYGITTASKQKFLSKPSEIFKEDAFRTLQVSGKRSLGPSTVCEAMIKGTEVFLQELQLKLVHTLISQARAKPAGRVAFITGSDFQSRHRVTMESTFGHEKDKHCLSTVLSSDGRSRLSWGLASSLNVNENLVVFSRYNNDAHAGQRLVVQVSAASWIDFPIRETPFKFLSLSNRTMHSGHPETLKMVSHLDERNTVSPICATTLGRVTQGGLTWTYSLSQRGAGEESVQVKALCSSNGAYMVSVKAQLGEVDC